MPDWHAIAAHLRALIHAQAPPAVDQIFAGLPDAALLAAGPAALALVLIVLFAAIGALTGGKKRKARRPEALDQDGEDDLPPPPVVTRAPPLKVVESRDAEPKVGDKRAEILLEALRSARAPDAEPSSREEIRARDEAVLRVLKEYPAAAKLFLAGDVAAGFDKLAEDAAALEKGKTRRAAQIWRDLGILAEGVDRRRSLQAFEDAFAQDREHFWGAVFLARLREQADKPQEALEAARCALAVAKGPREKAIGNAEQGDAQFHCSQFEPARSSYQAAIDSIRAVARTGARDAQRELSLCLTKLADLEVGLKNLPKARVLYEEDLTIVRHLATAAPDAFDAQRDLILALCKLAEITRDKQQWVEALGMVESLSRAGKWPASDAWMLDALKKQIAATP